MRLRANENFPLRSILVLRDEGFDVVSVGVEYQGTTDREVMGIAIRQRRYKSAVED